MKRDHDHFWLKIFALLVGSTASAWLAFHEYWMSAIGILLLSWALGTWWLGKERRWLHHVREFVRSVQYGDFSRKYPEDQKTRTSETTLFAAFNEINRVFLKINSDRQIQHHYLQKVINLLDLGLLFYRVDSGEVIWINAAFQDLFGVPHLKRLGALEKRLPELYRQTIELEAGQSVMNLIPTSKGRIKMRMQASAFVTQDGDFRIVSYQNLSQALDQTEARAWHKLLRVLTHELMNSIAPITSLAEIVYDKLEQADRLDESDDLKEAVATIRDRSRGLLLFTKNYRLIDEMSLPQTAPTRILKMFEGIHQLLEPNMSQRNIEFDLVLGDTRLQVDADVNLIEQVLINILLNAMDAVKTVEKPRIVLRAFADVGGVRIQLVDNGAGISPENRDQIFTPFFTTKKGGTGVGLTLSKQIMLLHGGNLFVDSEEGRGTTVTLQF